MSGQRAQMDGLAFGGPGGDLDALQLFRRVEIFLVDRPAWLDYFMAPFRPGMPRRTPQLKILLLVDKSVLRRSFARTSQSG
jgi:hypothetical protein